MAVIYRRGVGAALLAEVSKRMFFPIVLVAIDWPESGWVYAQSGKGLVSWDGHDWLGVGPLSALSIPAEAGGTARRAVMDLIAPPDDTGAIVTAIFGEADKPVRGRLCRVYFGSVVSRGSTTLVGDPVEVFAGSIDAMRFPAERKDGVLYHRMRLEVATGPSATASATPVHSYEDQIAAYPGDTGGRHLISAQSNLGQLRRG